MKSHLPPLILAMLSLVLLSILASARADTRQSQTEAAPLLLAASPGDLDEDEDDDEEEESVNYRDRVRDVQDWLNHRNAQRRGQSMDAPTNAPADTPTAAETAPAYPRYYQENGVDEYGYRRREVVRVTLRAPYSSHSRQGHHHHHGHSYRHTGRHHHDHAKSFEYHQHGRVHTASRGHAHTWQHSSAGNHHKTGNFGHHPGYSHGKKQGKSSDRSHRHGVHGHTRTQVMRPAARPVQAHAESGKRYAPSTRPIVKNTKAKPAQAATHKTKTTSGKPQTLKPARPAGRRPVARR